MLNDWERLIISPEEIKKEASMVKFRVEIKKNPEGKWFWHLKTRNGKILAHSENYSSRAKALKTATLINEHMVSCVISEIVK